MSQTSYDKWRDFSNGRKNLIDFAEPVSKLPESNFKTKFRERGNKLTSNRMENMGRKDRL